MTTANVRALRSKGPLPPGELPNNVGVSDKMHGLAKFDVGATSDSASSGGHTTPVYYLFEGHDKRLVLEEYVRHNQDLVESVSTSALRRMLKRHGKSWHGVIDEAVPPRPDGSAARARAARGGDTSEDDWLLRLLG